MRAQGVTTLMSLVPLRKQLLRKWLIFTRRKLGQTVRYHMRYRNQSNNWVFHAGSCIELCISSTGTSLLYIRDDIILTQTFSPWNFYAYFLPSIRPHGRYEPCWWRERRLTYELLMTGTYSHPQDDSILQYYAHIKCFNEYCTFGMSCDLSCDNVTCNK